MILKQILPTSSDTLDGFGILLLNACYMEILKLNMDPDLEKQIVQNAWNYIN